jgi:hypothetical protein
MEKYDAIAATGDNSPEANRQKLMASVGKAACLGETGKPTIDVNPWAWSGDHSMARDLIPGCLFSSVPVKGTAPAILDLPVTILDFFGFEKPQQMIGKSLLHADGSATS